MSLQQPNSDYGPDLQLRGHDTSLQAIAIRYPQKRGVESRLTENCAGAFFVSLENGLLL